MNIMNEKIEKIEKKKPLIIKISANTSVAPVVTGKKHIVIRKYAFTADQLSETKWKQTNILQLTRELIKFNVEVKGDKLQLVNLVREKILKLPALKIKETSKHTTKSATKIVHNFLQRAILFLLGNNKYKRLCQNDSDLDTTKPIRLIPDAYLFCLQDNSANWYGFDIRTLLQIRASNTNKDFIWKNPYTLEPLTNNVIKRIDFKATILSKFDFPTTREATLLYDKLSEAEKFNLYIIDIFQKLHHLDYTIDSNYLLELNATQLKQLYLEIADIWTYRLQDLTKEQRCKIVKNGIIFAEAPQIKALTPTAKDKQCLLKKILRNLDKLITEGETIDDKKMGATYFMLGFVLVSHKVALAYPHLAECVESY